MSKVIRIDDEVYEALLDRKHRMMTLTDVLAEMLAELDVEPFAGMLEEDEGEDDE